MSRRKHLLQSLEQEIEAPQEGQHIVRAVGSRGSNIIEVEFPDGRATLCLLPAKFHKKLWIKKGNYLIVEDAAGADGAVTGQIVAVLFADHVKQLRRMPGVWPPAFQTSSGATSQATQQLAALGLAESDSEGEGAAPGPASGSSSPAAASNGAAEGRAGGDGAAAGVQVGVAQQQPGGQQRQQQQQQQEAGNSLGQQEAGEGAAGVDEESGSSSEDDLPPIPRFNNRKVIEYEVSDSEDEDD